MLENIKKEADEESALIGLVIYRIKKSVTH
jgi:hypothetical protein